jgi:hypothetical protein
MDERIKSLLLHIYEAIPFRIVPAIITTIVLFTLLALPVPMG